MSSSDPAVRFFQRYSRFVQAPDLRCDALHIGIFIDKQMIADTYIAARLSDRNASLAIWDAKADLAAEALRQFHGFRDSLYDRLENGMMEVE